MGIHPRNLEALETIDAAFFSGDAFHGEDELRLVKSYLARWIAEVKDIRKMLNERDKENKAVEWGQ